MAHVARFLCAVHATELCEAMVRFVAYYLDNTQRYRKRRVLLTFGMTPNGPTKTLPDYFPGAALNLSASGPEHRRRAERHCGSNASTIQRDSGHRTGRHTYS